nr:MAG TPA: tail protein [Bacteriophage sp.]
MTRKRVNKILWHGNDLNEDGSAKAPSVASYAGALDGLNPGELYICDADGAPTLFMVTDGGRVVPIGGVNSEELKKLFIRKDTNDRTPFKLEVGDKLTAEKGLQISKNFVSGIIGGSGGYIYLDENGKVVIETDKAVFREEMITPKITFNCIDVISGDKANTFAFGTFKDVDTESRIATLDLLDNQWGTSHVSDICRGIFHNIGGSNTEKDTIGANGFIEYSGYATSYFTPTRILENEAGNMKFEYELQVGTNIHPMPGMNFFAYGNFKDKDRQAITYENRYYTRRLAHVNTWVIDPEVNVMMQTGDLSGLSIGGMDFSGYSFYGKNVYISGTIERLKPNGTPAKDLSYEGAWESGRKYDYYDSVTHDGSTWACMNKDGSSAEPGTNNDWQKIASKGDKGDPGESAVFADLTNQMDNVTLTNDGKVYQDTSISTVAWMSYGSKKMTLTGITCTLPANVTETHDVSTGEITFSVKQGVALDGRNPIPVALTATYNGKAYTGQLTFTLAGVKGGADAVLYRLVPSVSAVIKDANGNLNVTSVSCTRLKSSVSGGTAETGTGELKYSLDGGAEVSIGNNAGVPVSSFQKSIKFIFYVDGKEVDVETIPLVTDGKDGQSVSSLGRWHTGLIVPKLGIVTMGGSTFCAKKETANPPLWTTTTNDGRRITQTQDGGRTYGYILSGESNTEEYDLLVQSGKDGSDGTDYERVFIHTTEENRPSTPATSQTDDYIPSGWHDDPIGVSESLPFEWVSEREKKNGVWGNFSTPALWAKYGFDGKGVKYVDVLYAISTSNTTAPTTGWQTDAPAWENGKYIWSKTVTTYSDDSVEETSPVCITGGAGATGKGVKTITEYYYMSTSATTLTGGSWSTTRPTWENGKYIWTKSIITYTDNTTSETPGICVTGEKGESITAMGRWYTGLIVPKQGVVTMGGSSYIAKKETTNPPLWTVTTSSGQRIKQTQDGGKTYGYILSGEMNSAEYDLLASKGDTGAPGKDGTNGTDGKDGEQGIQGCIIRHSEWAVGVTYRNDEALTSGTRYVDIAMIRNLATIDGWDVYRCKTTHTSSESNKPGNTTYWEKLSNVGPIFTSLIISPSAHISFMQNNQLLIMKSDGKTVTAGLSGSEEGSKVRIWAGSATPDNAPFRVLESGKMIGTDVELTGTINAISGTIAGFKISGTSISSTDGAYDGGAGNNSYSNSKFFLHADGSSSAFLGFSATNKWVGIGLNCMPATSNMQVLGRFEDTGTSSYTYNKAGLYISIAGATTYDDSNVHGNSALYIPKGHITGFRRRFRRVSTSTTLTNMDSIVRLVNTAEITVTLPAGCEDGQEIWLCSGNEKKVNVAAASGDTITGSGGSFASNRWHIYIYDAHNRDWVYGYTNWN